MKGQREDKIKKGKKTPPKNKYWEREKLRIPKETAVKRKWKMKREGWEREIEIK